MVRRFARTGPRSTGSPDEGSTLPAAPEGWVATAPVSGPAGAGMMPKTEGRFNRRPARALCPRGTCATSQPAPGGPGTGLPKILLIEDNELNRDMLSRRLERRGFQVALAADGEQGVSLARAEVPDLILMDMSLPVIDGWEATRQLKSIPSLSKVPIIALTAHAMSGDREKALEAGCDDYDTKPIELPRLLEKIQALLAKGS